MNLTAKLLVAGSCLVIICSLIAIASRWTPERQRARPVTAHELSERLQKLDRDEPDDMGPQPSAYLWQERLGRAENYAALIDLALPAAQAGDADAQFALYGAFSSCRDMTRQRNPKCDGLVERFPDVAADANRWLAQSLEGNFPRALALDALNALDALTHEPTPKSEQLQRIESARSKLLSALNSNDPAITQLVPRFLPALFPDEPRVAQARWVWLMAACEQGLRCDSSSRLLREDCVMHDRCSAGESATAYIRRVSGDFPSLMARARNLARTLRNSALDAKTFDETVTSLAPSSNVVSPPARILERS